MNMVQIIYNLQKKLNLIGRKSGRAIGNHKIRRVLQNRIVIPRLNDKTGIEVYGEGACNFTWVCEY